MNIKLEQNSTQDKIFKYLTSAERLGQEIMSDKREIIMLDKRRNEIREAMRDLKKSGERKCYITVGTVFVKNKIEHALGLLEQDQMQINIHINKLRSNLKVKVNDLRDLEMQPPVPGVSLVPLSDQERIALAQITQMT